ncbi:uncharacterized protein MEPE_02681 [Melanopsichium pennsylvanicum]|uniref:Uncharacterized protein n=2 Tax=Melanopsichium pennsylvanicum TaxID=63383 RepID=A0AAJ4XKV7_9BASI|nr:putative protein [Melanopsichium pennsylvanicum 4]SNX83973.1 uncharacterized protein MEPE_02681 [Melanopsichium pennsylvanicum]
MSSALSNGTSAATSIGSENITASNTTSITGLNVTLLTFGPLSSCITLPNITAEPLPATVNLSDAAQYQVIQAWFTKLPKTSSCSTLAWKLKPDYSDHLNAMSTFQNQLEQLFPASNSTLGTSGLAGDANNTISTNTSVSTTAPNGISTFFGSGVSSSSSLSTWSTGDSLPSSLPLWMGVVVASTALVHLLALILHICSDLDVLFPALAAKLIRAQEESVLPSHIAPSNGSSATLVDSNTSTDPDAKVVDPPGYLEPLSAPSRSSDVMDAGLKPTPTLLRYSRKCKRLIVPLLLVSALATIAVAVVLNSKFAAGAVTTFPSSASSVVSIPSASVNKPSSTMSMLTANSSSVMPMTSASSSSSSSKASGLSSASVSDVTGTGTNVSETSKIAANADDKSSSSVSPTMSKLVRRQLVRRQTNFFTTPSSSSTSSAPMSSSSDLAQSSSSSAATQNSSLSSSILSPSSSASSSLLTSASPIATPTAIASSNALTTSTATGTTNSSSNDTTSDAQTNSLFVLSQGDSMHRLWWIVMIDLLLWFCQRRRTRAQIAFDKARKSLLAQISIPIK